MLKKQLIGRAMGFFGTPVVSTFDSRNCSAAFYAGTVGQAVVFCRLSILNQRPDFAYLV